VSWQLKVFNSNPNSVGDFCGIVKIGIGQYDDKLFATDTRCSVNCSR
jgi:hypothetical protein